MMAPVKNHASLPVPESSVSNIFVPPMELGENKCSIHILRYPGVMAQDPEDDEEQQNGDVGDTSHSLDMVTIYTSLAVDAEMEADMIHGVLESNGVPSLVVRATGLAPLGFEVQVPRARLEEAGP